MKQLVPRTEFKEGTCSLQFFNWRDQGRINHWANRANARGLALLGASRLNIKTLLYWFFVLLSCSARVTIAELFCYCVQYIG